MMYILSVVAALVILLNGVFGVIRKMDKRTPHGIRFAWVSMTTGAFGTLVGLLSGMFYPTPWNTLLLLGFAGYIVFDRRRRNGCEVPA